MAIPFFSHPPLQFALVQAQDLPQAQEIFDRNAAYHNAIVHKSPQNMAQACLNTPAPTLKDSRVFKYFLLINDAVLATTPVAVLDLFVGFPHYKIASIASLLVRENLHRKGIASNILCTLPILLAQMHPAVTTLSISLTDNNVAALRCLIKNEFKRVDTFQKHEEAAKSYTILTFRKTFRTN